MKKTEKQMIGVLILITVIVIIVGIVMGINKKEKQKDGKTEIEREENNTEVGEFVNVLEDGTKLNTSNKLTETKTIDGLEIGNLQLTTKDNVSLILGEIKNNTDTARGGFPVDLTLIDKEGKEIITIGAYIQELKPGKSAQFNTSATFDFANAYDFTIKK